MINEEKIAAYAKDWAFDMGIRALSDTDIKNVDVINQSIEMILATPQGSRLFNLGFGSRFSLFVFDNMTEGTLGGLLDVILVDIKKWEDRIYILEDQVRIIGNQESNSIELYMPYIMYDRNIPGEFYKKIQG